MNDPESKERLDIPTPECSMSGLSYCVCSDSPSQRARGQGTIWYKRANELRDDLSS